MLALAVGALLASAQALPTDEYDYCDPPRLDAQAYSRHPDPAAQLLLVQVVSRHGDRSPCVVLPHDDAEWTCGIPSYAAAEDPNAQFSNGAFMIPETTRMWRGNCTTGQLTSKGFEQLRKLGE